MRKSWTYLLLLWLPMTLLMGATSYAQVLFSDLGPDQTFNTGASASIFHGYPNSTWAGIAKFRRCLYHLG